MKILVINGPNINMLGIREPQIYGRNSYSQLLQLLDATAIEENIQIEHYQSNHEGCIVDKIQQAYGNIDAIADEQSKLFKKEKYHPMASIIPLILQIVLLLAVVYIIYHPMSYLFAIPEDVITTLANYIGVSTEDSSFQLAIIDALKNGILV